MIGRSVDRVQSNTSATANREIARRTEGSIAYFREHPGEIPERLEELDREWDVERALATASACFSLLGLGLSLVRRRGWIALPVVVQGFYLQHALQGWCPPLPVLRALGFRTPAEIEHERCALQSLHGDGPRRATATGGASDAPGAVIPRAEGSAVPPSSQLA